MTFDRNKLLPYLVLMVMAIPLFLLNIYNLHSWGDDFSQYIKEGQNIAYGRPYYLSNYVFNKYNPVYAPPQYPPLYPLMLAPVIRIWGLSFTAMCYLNSVIATGLLLALFTFFRRYAGVIASICLAIAITYSGAIIDLKRNVIADIPTLLFVTLYLAARTADTFSCRRIMLLILLAVAAIQTRSQAIFLLPAELLYALFTVLKTRFAIPRTLADWRNRYPGLFIIVGMVALDLLVDKVILRTPTSTSGFYNNFTGGIFGQIRWMIRTYSGYVLDTLISFFHYDTSGGFLKILGHVVEISAVAFAAIGLVVKCLRKPEVHDVFFMVMCGVVLFYPVRDPRYFLPAVPVLYLYCYFGIKTLTSFAKRLDGRWAAAGLTAIYLLCGSALFKTAATVINPGGIPQHVDSVAFNYLRQHVKDNEIIVFTKPRALTLFTDRKAMNASWHQSLEGNKRVFDSMGVKYMLILNGFEDGMFKDYIRKVQRPLDSVIISGPYILYKLR